MEKLTVDLAGRSYDILIGENLLAELPKHLPQKKTLVITDKNVAKHHLPKLKKALAGIDYKVKILPAGEGTKSFAWLQEVCDWLLANKPERKTTIIAFGGGVIGDLVGFAASIVLRGINFIQVPTTLLAQVDSSVGGKTAVNSKYGKNLIGAFYQPKLVLADVALLKTLPKREFMSGYAEIIKYGLINKPEFFEWLDKNLLQKKENLIRAIYESCKAKAEIVSADEREGGIRALLNLGHTFGHAFEAATGFSSKLLHGEAVALGIICAFRLSEKLGIANDTAKVLAHFKKVGLPTDARKYIKKWNVPQLIKHMRSDKKNADNKIVFILTRGIGHAFVSHGVEEKQLKEFLGSL